MQKNETNNQKNISGGKKVSKTSGKLVSRETASRKVLKNDNSVFINGSRSRKTRDQITSYNYDLLNVPAPSLPYAEKTILQQQVRIMKPDKSAFISHKPTPYSIELAASKVFYSAKKNIETTDTIAIKLLAKSENADEKISAYVISAKLLYAFNHRFTIQAGINYLKIDEKLKFNHTEFYKQLNIDTSTYYILFPFSPPLLITEIDSTIESLSKNHDIRHHVKTEIVTILAGVRFNFPTGRFLIEPTITVNADLLTLGKGASNFNPELIDRNGARHYKKDIRFSISAGIQVGYSINEKLNVFIASGYQYAFAPITTTMDFYGQKLNLLSTGAGIRYTIFSKQATKTNLHGSDIVNN